VLLLLLLLLLLLPRVSQDSRQQDLAIQAAVVPMQVLERARSYLVVDLLLAPLQVCQLHQLVRLLSLSKVCRLHRQVLNSKDRIQQRLGEKTTTPRLLLAAALLAKTTIPLFQVRQQSCHQANQLPPIQTPPTTMRRSLLRRLRLL
jgi:hypothetical protein